jgi:LPS sulfotransferase NodH
MQVTKPIFILGTGRCGSTLLHRLLALHPNVMWLSGFCTRYPKRPEWNRWAVSALDFPPLRRLLGRKIRPGEAWPFWDTHAYGFAGPCRDLDRRDVTPRVKAQLREVLSAMLTPSRNRLLLKVVGWPRTGYLTEVFEDAKFIHIVRDGRAVASSSLHVGFWHGWHGPQAWRAGLLSPEDQATWEQHDCSFVALAALHWRIWLRSIEAARRTVDPSRFHEIRYETLCAAPREVCRHILEFAELPASPAFEKRVQDTRMNTSDRWRDDLTPSQRIQLETLLREDLTRYGYEVTG